MNNSPIQADFDRSTALFDETGVADTEAPILGQYWHKLLRWKWVVLGIVAGALALGVVATLLMTPEYTAQTRLEISREEQNVTNVKGLENVQSSQDDEFYQTQYSNLSSRSLALRVVRSLRLMNNDGFFAANGIDPGDGVEGAAGMLKAGQGTLQIREQLAVDILLQNVAINPIPRSRLVDIDYTSTSPDLAAMIADQWAKDFIAASIDRRFASTSDAREFLEQRLGDLAQKLEESERRAVQYAAANDIVALGNVVTPDGRSMVDRTLASADLEALNSALAQATADRIAAESRARVRGASESSLTNVTVSGLRQRRAEAAAEYARLMTQFQPGYPPARALQEQIAGLDRAIAVEENTITASRSAFSMPRFFGTTSPITTCA